MPNTAIAATKPHAFLRWGLAGLLATAVCCFTPVLVFVLGLFGLSWFTGYLDVVLLPLLGLFAGMSIVGYLKMRRNRPC